MLPEMLATLLFCCIVSGICIYILVIAGNFPLWGILVSFGVALTGAYLLRLYKERAKRANKRGDPLAGGDTSP